MKTQEPKKDYLINDVTKNVHPTPKTHDDQYIPRGALNGKHAVIIGGDSGIGRAVGILFAKEGASITFTYTENERDDAIETMRLIGDTIECSSYQLDIGDETTVTEFLSTLDTFDYLIYNPAEQHYNETLSDITSAQLHRVFQTNVFGAFYLLIHGLQKINEEGVILFTTSVTAFDGNPNLLEYSSSKGALTSLMRSLSQHEEVLTKRIRINAVAPGPVWTPLIPATIPNYKGIWGGDTPIEDTAQPVDIAYTFLYLCDPCQKFVNGQTIHVNGKKTS